MFQKLFIVFSLIGILFAPSLVLATTLYVIPGAGATGCSNPDNDYNPATNTCGSGSDLVYTTIAGALDAESANDTIEIRAGTYMTSIQDTITSGTGPGFTNVTTVRGYNGEIPVIQPASYGGGFACVLFIGPGKSSIILQDLDLNAAGCTGGGSPLRIGTDPAAGLPSFIRTTRVITRDSPTASGVLIAGTNVEILDCISSNNGGAGIQDHGIYWSYGGPGLVRGCTLTGNDGGGVQIYHPSNAAHDIVIEHNLIYANQPSAASWNVFLDGTNNIFRHNIVIPSAGDYGINICCGSPRTGIVVEHNSVYGGVTGVSVASGFTSTVLRNNLILGATTAISNSGTGTVQQGNITSGTATDYWVDPANRDLTLKAGAAAIDAGSTATSLPYNGVAPTVGATDPPRFASCTVEDGDASTIRVTFTNNVHAPLLPATGITTFTARKATVADVVTAAVRTGDSRVDLTLTDAIANGNAVDISWASGNLTDSALIGSTLNQGYKAVLTNQSCTNNVGAAAGHVFTQAAFEFHGLRGTEAAPVGTPYATAPENTNIQVIAGGSVRLRLSITCTTSDCPATGFYPFYSCAACTTAGTYTQVPDTFVADEDIGFCGTSPDPDIPTNGTATTDQLSTAGTFVPGAFVRTSNAIPTLTIPQNQKSELEYCFSFSTSATAARTYDIRLYKQDATAIDAYIVTPRMTIAPVSAGMGF